MTTQQSENTPETAAVESITDPESLRGRTDIRFHEETDFVDKETFDMVDGLDNLAVVGVTNDDGDVLVMRITEDCAQKMPLSSVKPGEDYAEAARQWVAEQTRLTIMLDAVEAVWRYEFQLENEERKTTRNFVVFSASPVTDEMAVDDPADDILEESDAAAVGWFDELPDDAEKPPGTQLFFD